MASPDTADAIKCMVSALVVDNKYRYAQTPRQQGKTLMACRNFEDEMNALRRCGCNKCREKYYYMERDLYRSGRQNYEDHFNRYGHVSALSIPQLTMEITKVEAKIEEPKNYAVKLLVDQLKAQQGSLASKNIAINNDKTIIKTYQTNLKTKNGEKLGIESKIKELAGALKKLGHKE